MVQKYYYARNWEINRTIRADEVIIDEGATFTVPEGKFLTLTVNGIGTDMVPGVYKGDVVITLSNIYKMPPHGLMKMAGTIRDFHCAKVIKDGRVDLEYGVDSAVTSGVIEDEKAEGVVIASSEERFNGILVTGDKSYDVNNCEFYLEGFGADDFSGVGAGVAAIDRAKVSINDSRFAVNGVTRCAIHAGGDCELRVNNCTITGYSPDSDWVKDFSWAVGFTGSNRLCQLTDNAKVWYTNCDMKTNGWGIMSIDGTDNPVEMHLKDCRMELEGPRAHGYGAFCIGDNYIGMDHCELNVNGYPFMLMGMEGEGRAEIVNGCKIKGRRFGVFVIDDDNSILTIADSTFHTRKSSIVMKGSSTIVNISSTEFHPENGVVLQLMDNDEGSMNMQAFYIPMGVKDEYIEGRDLSEVTNDLDVTFNIKDTNVEGDFLNSTTNIRARDLSTQGGRGQFHDNMVGIRPEPPEGAERPLVGPAARHNGNDLQGPKNLGLNLAGSHVIGVISSAVQKYKKGLGVITMENRYELSNVTQTAAPTVNNGVVVSLDETSSWTITGTSYITGLKLAPGASVKAANGQTLIMTVDGKETAIEPGEYKGTIVMTTK